MDTVAKAVSLAERGSGGVAWRVSGRLRVFPDFIVIGAQKAGTTSLYDSLCQHHGVIPARKKEVRFFDRHWDRGALWYRWNFPTRWAMRGHRVTGEATPDYLVDPVVPGRIRSLLPRCKLVVLLRHPVDRAYSQYQMNTVLGVERRSFGCAIDDEVARLAAGAGATDWRSEERFHSYVERSLYAPQLERWFDNFPASSIHVTSLELLLTRTTAEMTQIVSFLGLPEVGDLTVLGTSNQRVYPGLDLAERARLFDLFEADLGRTEALIGRELAYRA